MEENTWLEGKNVVKSRENILTKAVAQAMPIYTMSCFDLIKTLCDDISAIIETFWWANQDNEKKTHWLLWEVLTKRKEDGGLGFRDLHLFNLAMLACRGGDLLKIRIHYVHMSWEQSIFSCGSFLMEDSRPSISYSWMSIFAWCWSLEKSTGVVIGNGGNKHLAWSLDTKWGK
jgi:hypothetical protein